MRFSGKLLLLSAFVVSLATAEVNFPEENGVLVLTDDNLELALSTFPNIMVEFYAPWCGHCKQLAPEYDQAAAMLTEKQSQMKLAKLDATQNSKAADMFSVTGFPTIKFFRSGIPIDYNGDRTAAAIVAFMESKSGALAVVLNTVDEALSFIAQSNFSAVLAGFKDLSSKEAEAYLLVASELDNYDFAITSEHVVMSHFDLQPDTQVALFRKAFHDKIVLQTESEESDLKKWIQVESLPYVNQITNSSSKFVFKSGIKMHLVLFAAEQTTQASNSLSEACLEAAKKHRGQLICVIMMPEDKNHAHALTFFGMSESDLPTFVLFSTETQHKFPAIRKNVVDQTEVNSLLEAYFNGTAKRHFKLEKLPETWNDKPVKYLTGENVEQVANDITKDVLIKVFAPWCGHCKSMAEDWEKLAEHFLNDQSVLIAELDGTQNELEWLKVSGFPTILHFKRETNEMVLYEGKRDLDSLVQFVKSFQTPSETEHSEL